MKTTNKVLGVFTRPVQLLLCAGAALLLSAPASFGQAASQPAATTTTTGTDVVQMQKYEVTGSRIKRLDSETVSPVVQLTQSDIQVKGFPTFADAIRSLTFNGGEALTPIDAGTSFTPGISTFNLRGLGNNNTLVLINGRRAASYATPGYDGLQSMFDLNSIPDAAIESMDLLKDGGSALYGSDAVAGVLNIKLRKDYQGSQFSVGYKNYFNTSSPTKEASVLMGTRSGKASVFVAGSWRDNAGIMARDLYYTRNADNTDIAHKANPRFVVTGTGDVNDLLDPGENPIDDGFFDNRSGSGIPGYVNLDNRYTFDGPTNHPTTANAVIGYNPYNYQQDTTFLPKTRTYSFYTRGSYDFNPYITAAVEVSLTHNEANVCAAPTPVVLANEHGLDTTTSMYIPSYNAFNPWGVDITSGARRLVEAGPRINNVTADSPRLLFSLSGQLPETTFFKDWTWDAGVLHSRSSVTNLNQGTVPDYRMQQALMGLLDDGNGGLIWSPTAPASERTYFNWFGVNDPRFGKFLSVNNPVSFINTFSSFDLHASGPVAQLPGGPIGVSLGYEHYMQSSGVYQTDLNATGNIIGGSMGSSWDGNRKVDAFFAEVDMPILKWLEAQVAGRYEKYSDDGFQKRVRPKFGIKVRPLDWLIVRASYAQSYRAPDLAYLYESQVTTFTASQYYDPAFPGDQSHRNQIQMNVVGNPELKPETTDTYYAGIAFEPQRGPLKGLGGSIDFFRFNQKNLLAQMTDFFSYSSILSYALQGVDPFVDMVKRSPAGDLLYINNPYMNEQTRKTQGLDVEVNYTWPTKKYGEFYGKFDLTYNIYDKIDGINYIGSTYGRRWNATLYGSWKYRDWRVNMNIWYLRGTDDYLDYGFMGDDYGELLIKYHIDDQIVVNLGVTYTGFWKTEITLGVSNLFNQRPPVDPTGTDGALTYNNWMLPAMWSITVSKKF